MTPWLHQMGVSPTTTGKSATACPLYDIIVILNLLSEIKRELSERHSLGNSCISSVFPACRELKGVFHSPRHIESYELTFLNAAFRSDAVLINIVCFVTSIYAGVAVFFVIGYMANEYNVPVDRVITSG